MKKSRRIVVEGTAFRWRYSHGHANSNAPVPSRECVETLTATPENRGCRLAVVFREGEGGSTTTGMGWGGHVGGLLAGGYAYNLNRPGLVALILKAAKKEGWNWSEPGFFKIEDGFHFLQRHAIAGTLLGTG